MRNLPLLDSRKILASTLLLFLTFVLIYQNEKNYVDVNKIKLSRFDKNLETLTEEEDSKIAKNETNFQIYENDFKSRRKHLEKMCNKFQDPFRPESGSLGLDPTSTISDFNYFKLNNNFHMICSIHKVGSNSMHNFLNKLQQFYQLEQQQQEESKDYNEPIMTREQHKTIFQSSGDVVNADTALQAILKSSVPVSEESWPDCARKLSKVIVVRHPLERLLSAYRYVFDSSLEVGNKSQHGVFYRGEESLEWADFVNHVINFDSDPKWTEKKDMVGSHWKPYWRFCSVCHPSLMPNYILKFEHLRADLKGYLDQLGLSEFADEFPQAGTNKGGHSSVKIQQYYSKLSKETIRQLYQVYKLDHDFFQYNPDQFIEYGFGE